MFVGERWEGRGDSGSVVGNRPPSKPTNQAEHYHPTPPLRHHLPSQSLSSSLLLVKWGVD